MGQAPAQDAPRAVATVPSIPGPGAGPPGDAGDQEVDGPDRQAPERGHGGRHRPGLPPGPVAGVPEHHRDHLRAGARPGPGWLYRFRVGCPIRERQCPWSRYQVTKDQRTRRRTCHRGNPRPRPTASGLVRARRQALNLRGVQPPLRRPLPHPARRGRTADHCHSPLNPATLAPAWRPGQEPVNWRRRVHRCAPDWAKAGELRRCARRAHLSPRRAGPWWERRSGRTPGKWS